MKKIISVLLATMLVFAFVACGETSANVEDTTAAEVVETPVSDTLSFGIGVSANYGDSTSADGETNGAGEFAVSVAAVLVDKDGKIVKCDVDTADVSAGFTSAGASVVSGEYKTKYELGNDYMMAAYGQDANGDGIVKEWFEQIDIFENAIVGKTIDEAKALVVNGYKAVEDVQSAGCTMGVGDYIKAVEKAYANAKESVATADDTLKVSAVVSADAKDATADSNGAVEFEVTVAAVATNGGKVTVCATDVVAAAIEFDVTGKALTDSAAELLTKREKGDNYGMAAYGQDLNGDGKVLEWYAQADAFDAACAGKTADEVAALVVNGYQAVEDVQSAGCTMGVGDIANAIVKAAK